jgi:hypothetical protein
MTQEWGWFENLVEDVRFLIREWVYDGGRDRPSAHALSWTCHTEQASSPLVQNTIQLGHMALVTQFYWYIVRGTKPRQLIIRACLECGRTDMLHALILVSPIVLAVLVADPSSIAYDREHDYYENACRSGDTYVLDWLHDAIRRPFTRTNEGRIHGPCVFGMLHAAIMAPRNIDSTKVLDWVETKLRPEKDGLLRWMSTGAELAFRVGHIGQLEGLFEKAFRIGHIAQLAWLFAHSNMSYMHLCDRAKVAQAIRYGSANSVQWLAERAPFDFYRGVISWEKRCDVYGLGRFSADCIISACFKKRALSLLIFLEEKHGLTLHADSALMQAALVTLEAMQFMRARGRPWCTRALIHAIAHMGHDVPVLRWMISEGCPCEFSLMEWRTLIQWWTAESVVLPDSEAYMRRVLSFLLHECQIPWMPKAWFAWFECDMRSPKGRARFLWRLLADEKCGYPSCVHASMGTFPIPDNEEFSSDRLSFALRDVIIRGDTKACFCIGPCDPSWCVAETNTFLL